MSSNNNIYKLAELYDIAFDFRDVAGEFRFFEEQYSEICGKKMNSFLEIGAGPAWHAREALRQGMTAAALDISPEMVDYGSKKALEEGLTLPYYCMDMTSFELPRKYDFCALLLDSASYLLTNQAFYDNLRSVAAVLDDRGLYLLELSHPKDVFRIKKTAGTSWLMERGGKAVAIEWGRDDDPFDPITQITETTVKITLTENNTQQTFTEKEQQRSFSLNELKALIDASQLFTLVKIFGALNSYTAITDENAWRTVILLQKIEK